MIIKIIQKDAYWCHVPDKKGQALIWHILSFTRTIMKFNYSLRRNIPTKVECSMLDKRGMKFPVGLVDYVSDALNKQGYEVEFHALKFPKLEMIKPELPGITFENYQNKVLEVVGNHSKGIIVAPTAAGKSYIAAGIIAKYDFPVTMLTTINKTIQKQFVSDFEKLFPHIEIGQVGDGICEVGHITIALYQSLAKYDLKKLNNTIELFLSDETHAATNSLKKIFSQLTKVNYKYGLTATVQNESHDKEKYFQMVGNIGPVIHTVTDEDCSQRVTDVEVYMLNNIVTKPKGKTYQQCFREDIILCEKRNRKLLEKGKELFLDKGLTCLFIVDEISQIKLISKIATQMKIKHEIAHGKNSTEINENIKKLLNDKKIKLVISSSVFRTGMNIPSLDSMILGSIRKSPIALIQSIGRVRRAFKGKDVARILDIHDVVLGNKKFHKHFKKYGDMRKELYIEKGWFKGYVK